MTAGLGIVRGSSGEFTIDPNEGVDDPVMLMTCRQHRLGMNGTPSNPNDHRYAERRAENQDRPTLGHRDDLP
jgi:hypothetical protein